MEPGLDQISSQTIWELIECATLLLGTFLYTLFSSDFWSETHPNTKESLWNRPNFLFKHELYNYSIWGWHPMRWSLLSGNFETNVGTSFLNAKEEFIKAYFNKFKYSIKIRYFSSEVDRKIFISLFIILYLISTQKSIWNMNNESWSYVTV